MHVVYLAIVGDMLTSLLFDLTDSEDHFPGRSRETRLEEIWNIYDDWCGRSSIPDKISRRLFSTTFLKAGKYLDIPQKVMSAASARYAIFFMATLMRLVLSSGAAETPELLWMAGVCWAMETMERLMINAGPRDFFSKWFISECEQTDSICCSCV
ncbi:unnamed protein product [Symbiodinium sp. CCMP2592]|nr:unnamed protein product [Symbiodinium sp. CCMP2592]